MRLSGEGADYTLFLSAHSNPQELKTEESASVYAASWIEIHAAGQKPKIISIRAKVSHKPRGQTLAEHERHYGVRDFYRFLTFVDLNGDDRNEVVVYEAQSDATDIHVYTWDGRTLIKVLSTHKPHSI